MSSNATDSGRARQHTRTFELESRFDDAIDPEEVTIFPGNAEMPTTQWLSIDAEFTVPIEETH